jgi:4-amino-4-deoxy-L-arabinose transferase-like glycosyltransferase
MPVSARTIRRDLLLLAVGAAALFTLFLGARDLWNPNEPLYGRAVVEMSERGDWLIPTVNDEVFNEKPILYYWLALASATVLGGVDEFTLRIPAAATATLCVLLVYLLAHPYAGRRRALLAAVLFATLYGIYWNARTAQMDILVTAATLGAILPVTRVLDHGFAPLRGWSLAGVAAGFGFLAKGPVGIICPGAVLLAYLIATGRLRTLRAGQLLVATLLCLVIVLPWFLLLYWAGEREAIVEMLFRQNFTRFVNPWDHAHPWYYYLVNVWIDMAPWVFFLPLAIALPGRSEGERRVDRLAWIWIVAIIIFFSLSRSKRGPYILPVAPAMAILASAYAERMLRGALGKARRRAGLLIAGVLGVLLIAGSIVLYTRILERYPLVGGAGVALTAVLLLGGLMLLASLPLQSRRPGALPAALLVFIVSFYLVIGGWALPAVNAYKSARTFCNEVKAWMEPDQPVRTYRTWQWRASYTYYMGQALPRIDSDDELIDYWRRPERVFLIVEQARVGEFRQVLKGTEPLLARPVGSREVFLFSNR